MECDTQLGAFGIERLSCEWALVTTMLIAFHFEGTTYRLAQSGMPANPHMWKQWRMSAEVREQALMRESLLRGSLERTEPDLRGFSICVF